MYHFYSGCSSWQIQILLPMRIEPGLSRFRVSYRNHCTTPEPIVVLESFLTFCSHWFPYYLLNLVVSRNITCNLAFYVQKDVSVIFSHGALKPASDKEPLKRPAKWLSVPNAAVGAQYIPNRWWSLYIIIYGSARVWNWTEFYINLLVLIFWRMFHLQYSSQFEMSKNCSFLRTDQN